MPLKKPMLSLAVSDDEDSDDDDDESDDEIIGGPSSNGSSGSAGLRRGLGGLSLDMPKDDSDGYQDESPPGGKRGRSDKPAPLKRQGSYDVTPTMTFQMDGLNIKQTGTLNIDHAGERSMKSQLVMDDLERLRKLGQGISSG